MVPPSQAARSYIGRGWMRRRVLEFPTCARIKFSLSQSPPSRVPHLPTWPISLQCLYPLSPLFFTVITLLFVSNQLLTCVTSLPTLTPSPSSPSLLPPSLQVHVEAYRHLRFNQAPLPSLVLVNNPLNSDDYREHWVINHPVTLRGDCYPHQ